MSRAPWRDALDAKIRLTQYVNGPSFERFMGQWTIPPAQIGSLKRMWRHGIALSEPIFVDTPVHDAVVRNLVPDTTLFKIDTSLLPPFGIVWLKKPMQLKVLDNLDEVPMTVCGVSYMVTPAQLAHRRTRANTTIAMLAWFIDPMLGLSPLVFHGIEYEQEIAGWGLMRLIDATQPSKDWIHAQLKDSALLGEKRRTDTEDTIATLYCYILRYMHTLFQFMDHRILVAPAEPVDRDAARDAQRNNIPAEVRVVRWRLKKYQKLENPSARPVD